MSRPMHGRRVDYTASVFTCCCPRTERVKMTNLKCCLGSGRTDHGDIEEDRLWYGADTGHIIEKAKFLEKYRSEKRAFAAFDVKAADRATSLDRTAYSQTDTKQECDRLHVTNGFRLYGTCQSTGDMGFVPAGDRQTPYQPASDHPMSGPKQKRSGTQVIDKKRNLSVTKGKVTRISHSPVERLNSPRCSYEALTHRSGSVFGHQCLETDSNSNSVHSANHEVSCSKTNDGMCLCISEKLVQTTDVSEGFRTSPTLRSNDCVRGGRLSDLSASDERKSNSTGFRCTAHPKRPLVRKCSLSNKNVPDLEVLSRKLVIWAHNVQRPLNCWLGKFGVLHVGVIVTTEDGEKWLVHKAKTNGTMDTVVSPVESMASNWSVRASMPVSNYTVGDFVKASGSTYNILTNNCWDARKRMMKLCDND